MLFQQIFSNFLIAFMVFFPFQKKHTACNVFGKIYVVSHAHDAQYRVFVEDNEYSADLVVFQEKNELLAYQIGKWYFTKNIHEADFTIYFASSRQQANFTIYFTEIDALARCNR